MPPLASSDAQFVTRIMLVRARSGVVSMRVSRLFARLADVVMISTLNLSQLADRAVTRKADELLCALQLHGIDPHDAKPEARSDERTVKDCFAGDAPTRAEHGVGLLAPSRPPPAKR